MRYMQISFNSRTIFSGYDCRKRCVGSADVSWPQSVGSGILKVHGTLVKYILNNSKTLYLMIKWDPNSYNFR